MNQIQLDNANAAYKRLDKARSMLQRALSYGIGDDEAVKYFSQICSNDEYKAVQSLVVATLESQVKKLEKEFEEL